MRREGGGWGGLKVLRYRHSRRLIFVLIFFSFFNNNFKEKGFWIMVNCISILEV